MFTESQVSKFPHTHTNKNDDSEIMDVHRVVHPPAPAGRRAFEQFQISGKKGKCWGNLEWFWELPQCLPPLNKKGQQ